MIKKRKSGKTRTEMYSVRLKVAFTLNLGKKRKNKIMSTLARLTVRPLIE